MRPILYSADETKFTSMGYGRLTECTSCYCEEERNGIFEVTFKYPTSGQLYKYISEGCYIKVKANDKQDLQIFKIYGSSKEINGEQEFYCEHISYRLNRIPLIGADIKSKTAKEAMNQLKSESLIQNDFTFESDIVSSLNSTIKVPVSVRKALGGVEGSILDTWGGEFEWDNMTVKLWKQRGEPKDLPIKYGLNLQKLNKKKSIDVVYTSVLPYVTYTDDDNVEHKITLSEKYLTYEEITVQELSIYVKDFSDQFSEGESKTEDALRTKCKQWMKTNKLYMPSISLSVEIVKLEQTEEYKDLLRLQSVNLCDYVPVVFEDIGVSEKIQVIKIKYDCLNERNDTIELGDKVSTLNEQVLSNSESSNNQIDKITQGYLDAIANATELITGNKGGHVVFRPGTRPEEILVMDTDNINTAKNVWRWNQSGLGHSSNGYEGPYDTAMTMDGSIVAKFIAAGVLTGMQLNGGSININNKFIVDSNGNMHVDGGGYFKGNIEGSNIKGSTIVGSTFKVQGTRTYNVSINDVEKIRQAMLGNYTPTAQEMMNWDIDNDGVLSASDMLYVERMANGTISKTFNVAIDLKLENNIPRILIRQYNSQKEFLTKLSYGSLITESVVSSRLEADLSIKSNVIELGNDNILYTIGFSNYTDEFNKSGKCININAGWLDSKQKFSDKVDFIKTDTDIISGHLRMRTGTGDYLSNTYIFHDYPAGYLCFGTGDGYIDSYGGRLYLDFKDANETYDMFVRPRSNGKSTLGDSNHRFYNVYLTHSPNVSSDRRVKKDFTNFDERYIKLFEMIEPIIYQLKSAPEGKSKLSGFIAQDIEGAMNKCGIDKREFGIVKYDEESDSYALIYDMFIPLMIYYIQTKEQDFENRLSKIERMFR